MHEIYKIYLFSLFLGYVLQFENPALLVSPLLSLAATALLAKYLQVRLETLFVVMYFSVLRFPLRNKQVCCFFVDEYEKGNSSFKDAESHLFLFGIHGHGDFESYNEGNLYL